MHLRPTAAWLLLAGGGAIVLAIADASLLLGGVFLALALVAGALLLAAVRSAGRGARELTAAAADIARGELRTRAPVSGDGGLRAATEAFNRMAGALEERIEGASRERNRLLAAINSSSGALVAVDADNSIAFANRAAEALFGQEREALKGKPFGWMLADATLIDALRRSREEGRQEDCIIERPNRQVLQASVTPILGGGSWSSLVVFSDLTDVKRVEQLRRDFVANVSHELRTPLAAIKSVIETLQGGAMSDPAAAADFLSRADAEVDRLVHLVEELLELSRIESGGMREFTERVDLAAAAESAVARLGAQVERSGVSLTLEAGPGLPAVSGDRAGLERAVVNLLDNALKFTPQGGSAAVRVHAEGGGVRLEVSDTGAGIDPNDLPRVFERFYKADRARAAGGTGLGLAIVKHTVEAHGGTVEAVSRPGRGSTFGFWLPAAAA